MYDDGYNRKKSKKKKRKQSGSREKKLKTESKSKKEVKIISTPNVNDIVKLEIKTEVEDINTFEDISQENSDDIPVIQGNYNDNIIIENEPTEDPLKIDPESVDKSTKKRKKHSSHSGQKKIRLKHTSKSKSKQDNISFYTHTSTLNMSNVNVQHKNMSLTDLHSVHTITDISNNEGNVNALPGNIISLGNELSMTNIKNEIIDSNQIINFDCSNDNGTEIVNTVENKAINTCLLKDIKSDTNKVISNTYPMKKNYNAIVQKNSGYQNESTKAVIHVKQDTKLKTAMSTEHETIKNKNLIKAPRLSIPLSMRVSQPENTAASQKTWHSTMNMTNTGIMGISSDSSATQPVIFVRNSTFHNNPPVLQNELEASYVGNDNTCKNIPQLEHCSSVVYPFGLPSVTPINKLEDSLFPNNSILNQSVFNQQTMRLESATSVDNTEESGRKKFWGDSPSIRFSGIVSKPAPAPMLNKGNIQIQKLPSHISPNTMSGSPVMRNYSLLTSVNNMMSFQNADALAVMNSASAIVPNSSKRATTKNTTRQKSQKRQTSRKKSSSKNDKSNNNTFTSISQTNVTSTSIGTQVNHPIDVSALNYNLSNEDNVPSPITNTQGTVWNMYSSIEKKSAVGGVQLNESEDILSSNISDNIKQLEDSIKKAINTHPHLSSSKRSQISILRKKPKEKLKKSTTRKKQIATIVPAIEVTRDQTDAKSTRSTDMSQSNSQPITSMIPGHISEMIYPNIPNNDLLKAFNNYWSAQVSHCAICATFASCTSGNSRVMPPDWRYCQSTTLPENTPIWVREIKV